MNSILGRAPGAARRETGYLFCLVRTGAWCDPAMNSG